MIIPERNSVDWVYFGPAGPHPELDGVTGRRVRIIQPKNLSKYESVIANLLGAPKVVNRDLDDLNSLLWELIDGQRDFNEICIIMESTFHERIIPTAERISASLDQLLSLGYIGIGNTERDEVA